MQLLAVVTNKCLDTAGGRSDLIIIIIITKEKTERVESVS